MYWLSAGPGDFHLSTSACVRSTFSAVVVHEIDKEYDQFKVINHHFSAYQAATVCRCQECELSAKCSCTDGSRRARNRSWHLAWRGRRRRPLLTAQGCCWFPRFDRILAGCFEVPFWGLMLPGSLKRRERIATGCSSIRNPKHWPTFNVSLHQIFRLHMAAHVLFNVIPRLARMTSSYFKLRAFLGKFEGFCSRGSGLEMDHEIWQAMPKDLLTYILLRLPPRAFVRFRATSKDFDQLLTSPTFLEKHAGLQQHQPLGCLFAASDCIIPAQAKAVISHQKPLGIRICPASLDLPRRA